MIHDVTCYHNVDVTPAPVWVPTQWLLVPSFNSVVGYVENFSPCPRIQKIGKERGKTITEKNQVIFGQKAHTQKLN